MTPVSAVLITLNEERVIARCLRSLTWADEIVIVDAESKDRTRAICEDPAAPWAGKLRFLSKPWEGFRIQRNFALKAARHDRVLVVDADEECTPELAAKIRELVSDAANPPHPAYKVRRVEYFLGKSIHHGCWNPSYQDRFFDRRGVEYINDIHEYPRFAVSPKLIHEPFNHWPDFAPERFLEKMNKYTTIEARDRVKQGQRTNWFRILGAFPAMFWKNYFYYSAWKDGYHGFVISILEGVSRAVRHVKMWQIQRGLAP